AHLLFSCSAIAAAAISAFELWMMNARTAEQYQLLVRWVHVPTWVLTVSFVSFVRLYLHAGRPWLVWSIYTLRTLVLILNFIFPISINFRAITDLRHFSWAGEIVSVPVGVRNPWLRIMRYRAQCIGGHCKVQSNAAKGTTVSCRVPLDAQPAVFSLA